MVVKERRCACYQTCQWVGGQQTLGRHDILDEELKTPDNVGKAEELLKGVGVSVSEDVDADDDDSAEDVVDGAPSFRPGIEAGRDTLGNALSRAVRAALTAAGISNVVCGGSGLRVWTLVSAPVASM